MNFKSIKCVCAFYDNFYNEVFYEFETIPAIDDNDWVISASGDVAYNSRCDFYENIDFPKELLELLEHIPEDIEIDW